MSNHVHSNIHEYQCQILIIYRNEFISMLLFFYIQASKMGSTGKEFAPMGISFKELIPIRTRVKKENYRVTSSESVSIILNKNSLGYYVPSQPVCPHKVKYSKITDFVYAADDAYFSLSASCKPIVKGVSSSVGRVLAW